MLYIIASRYDYGKLEAAAHEVDYRDRQKVKIILRPEDAQGIRFDEGDEWVYAGSFEYPVSNALREVWQHVLATSRERRSETSD